jgi:DNA-binding NarL/FixJ family response regulator
MAGAPSRDWWTMTVRLNLSKRVDPSPTDARTTVLVVDDTPDSLRCLTSMLVGAGMTVLTAADGMAAIDVMQQVMPDLVLMDAIMPGLDGFETTRRLKTDQRLRHLPVIFMTGLTGAEHVVRAFEAGGVDYVRKPVVMDELLARIRVHLANARMIQGSQIALDTSGRPCFALDASGAAIWFTPLATTMLQRLIPDWLPRDMKLPEVLAASLRHLQSSAPTEGAQISTAIGDTTLDCVFLRRTASDEWLFRLSEQSDSRDERLLAEQLGLTSREAEVLLWISRGKQNRQVSKILRISPQTVNKHVAQIFKKLDVDNRASATAIAVSTLNGP